MTVSFLGVTYTFVIPAPNDGEANRDYHDRVNKLNPDVPLGGAFGVTDQQKPQALTAWANKIFFASFGINYPVE